MTEQGADLLIRATVHTLVPGQAPQRAVAVQGDRIIALSAEPRGLDDRVTPSTKVLDLPGSTVLPSFDDTHSHLILAGLAAHDVPVHDSRNIGEMLDAIRQRAALTPPGEWIRTTPNWLENNLAERRMPTAAELDQATDQHPVLVKRGGHNVVVNHYALRLAGITEDTPVPAGGIIGRDADGRLNGRLVDTAMYLIERLLPTQDPTKRLDGLQMASDQFAAGGVGTVRDAMVPLSDYALLRAARDAGTLKTRVRALIAAFDRDTVAKMNDLLDDMEDLRYEADPWLRVWGLKLGLDGGIEAGATEESYVGDPHFHGHMLFEDPDAMVPVVETAVRRGWRVGTHAYGDRAARVLLDVYERVLANNPGLPAGTLVMEHGGLAGSEQRARAVTLGVPVTIQQPLLHDAAAAQREYWGPERVAALFPAREWIDQGAQVSGGSDWPVGQIGAMRSIWGMITRETVIGVQGPEHAISYEEAVALHTVQAARLNREEDLRGTLTPGRLADFTVWAQDPAECPIESLAELDPTHTLLGGRLVHSPETESA